MMAKLSRRSLMKNTGGVAAAAGFALLIGTDAELDTTPEELAAVGECTFVAYILQADGFLPRKGMEIRLETPALTARGVITELGLNHDVNDLLRGEIRGRCKITPKEFSGKWSSISCEFFAKEGGVGRFAEEVDRSGVIYRFNIYEA